MDKIMFAVAIDGENGEEYLMQESGDDCFTDDIGCAILYDTVEDFPEYVEGEYYVKVRVSEDNEIELLERQ